MREAGFKPSSVHYPRPTDIFALKMEGLERSFFIKSSYENDRIEIRSPLGSTTVKSVQTNDGNFKALTSNGDIEGHVQQDGNLINIEFAGQYFEFIHIDPNAVENVQVDFSGSLTAPLPGKVIRVELAVGDRVQEGQDIIILESMKMEIDVVAPRGGVIQTINVATNDKVVEGQVVAVLG